MFTVVGQKHPPTDILLGLYFSWTICLAMYRLSQFHCDQEEHIVYRIAYRIAYCVLCPVLYLVS